MDVGRSEKQPPDPGTSRRNLQEADLKAILADHQVWLDTGSREGNRADLSYADLEKAPLRGGTLSQAFLMEADLRKADLQHTDLRQANLSRANLDEAQLFGATLDQANLFGATLRGANLHRASLREATLQDANLADAHGLLAEQLAGANVSGARLPSDIQEFAGLRHVEELSKNARTLFVSMLLGCLYTWLTVATTTDARLLTNSVSSPLPVLQTEIPIAGFYWTAPMILTCLYLYFHLYLQRFWGELGVLPAIFPDGKTLDQKTYPWLMNSLIWVHVSRLRELRPPLSSIEAGISIALGWWLVPWTLLLLWGRYLPRHDKWGSAVHVLLIVLVLAFAATTYRLAAAALHGKEIKPFRARDLFRDARRGVGLVLFGAAFGLALLSVGAIQVYHRNDNQGLIWGGVLLSDVLKALESARLRMTADLYEAEVSTKPAAWTGTREDEIASVRGATLRGQDLRYATARGAFLVKADLREADLEGADLSGADLRKADLAGARLGKAEVENTKLQKATFTGAFLQKANLRGALAHETDLEGANLQGADLRTADFRKANFRNARLQKALLRGANLVEANLEEASLEEADLTSANLQKASLINARLQNADLKRAYVVEALLRNVDLRKADLTRADLRKANLMGADLQGAKLRGADLREAYLRGAKLIGADLTDASLQKADLTFANLSDADLRGADLQQATLRQTYLSNVKGLIQGQVNHACLDKKTKLPQGLKPPKLCIQPELFRNAE